MKNEKIKEFINRNNIVLAVLSIAIVLISILSISYAYFTTTIGNDNATSVIVRTGALGLIYTNGTEIRVEKALPGWNDSKVFTVENTSSGTIHYELSWTNITNEFETRGEPELVYTLSGANIKTETQMPYDDATILAGIPIAGGAIHYYTLDVLFKNLGINQNHNMDKLFMGKIEIRESIPTDITITFAANGATISSTSEECTMHGSIPCDITTPDITRDNFNIIGWSTNQNDTGATIASGEVITANRNMTYYAITDRTITTTFNRGSTTLSGGSGVNGSCSEGTNTRICTCVIRNAATSCSITSPTIAAGGITVLGYGTASNATTSAWNSNTASNRSADATFFAIRRYTALAASYQATKATNGSVTANIMVCGPGCHSRLCSEVQCVNGSNPSPSLMICSITGIPGSGCDGSDCRHFRGPLNCSYPCSCPAGGTSPGNVLNTAACGNCTRTNAQRCATHGGTLSGNDCFLH